MAENTLMMEMGFNIIYLIWISAIVILMTHRLKAVNEKIKLASIQVRNAFFALLIGDLGHVGARLIAFSLAGSDGNVDDYGTIIGIGALFEMVGLSFLFMIYTNAWRITFQHPKDRLYYILLGIGIFGLIIYIFPQNHWDTGASLGWSIFRNIPWFLQGLLVSILIIRDAKKQDDKLMNRIGLYILISYFFYLTPVLFGSNMPMLYMLMIPGTIIYMLWQNTSYKRFFM